MTCLCFYAQSFPKSVEGNYPDPNNLFLLINRLMSHADKIIIYISSLHFGTDSEGRKYLHLNDQNVDEVGPFLAKLKTFIDNTSNDKLEFRFMLGGAGGAYHALFSDYETYYDLLRQFIVTNEFISGIDLDVEEELDTSADLSLLKIKKLIKRIYSDTHGFMDRARGFNITLAPVASSLIGSEIGLGGFSYKDLLKSSEGAMISGLNVQVYGCFNQETFRQIVENHFSPKILTIGMLGDEFTSATEFASAMTTIEDSKKTIDDVQGFILWESGDSTIDPYQWGRSILRAHTKAKEQHKRSSWTGMLKSVIGRLY